MKGKVIFEWLFWILLSVFLFGAGIDVAFLSPVVILFAPVPLMLLTCRLGPARGAMGACFGALLTYLLMGPVSAFMYSCEFGLLGFSFGCLFLKAKNGVEFIMAAILSSISIKILLMLVFIKSIGFNPFVITPETAQQLLSSVSGALSQGGLSVSQETLKAYAEAMVETVTIMMPSMLILFAALDSLVSFSAARAFLKKKGFEGHLLSLPPFGLWKFPKNIFWALLAALVLDMGAKAWPERELFKMLSLNLMEVLRGVFLVQGLSLLWYFMSSRGLPKAVKVILTFFCALFAPVSYVLSMLGIFDIWYDLRKRIKLRRKNK